MNEGWYREANARACQLGALLARCVPPDRIDDVVEVTYNHYYSGLAPAGCYISKWMVRGFTLPDAFAVPTSYVRREGAKVDLFIFERRSDDFTVGYLGKPY